MKVSDYMSASAVTANLHDGLRQTYIRMRERDIRHMPVVDAHERVVGIVSDRDSAGPTPSMSAPTPSTRSRSTTRFRSKPS